MIDVADKAGVRLMYGESWVYAPSINRAAELIEVAGGKILEMRGGECHSGSHSPYSKRWRNTGGGALIRLGVHPLGAMLYLKRREGASPISVTAEVGDLSRDLPDDSTWIGRGWQDVENWAAAIVSFDDGSRCIVNASDVVLGGMESRLDIFLENAHFKCNLSPNNLLQAYTPDASVFGDAYIMEKVHSGAGWTTPMPDEDWSSGHLAMVQDFIDAIAEGRPAKTDGALGRDVLHVVYAAYQAAAEGKRVEFR